MRATIAVTPKADRESRISLETAIRTTQQRFQGRLQDIPVKRVPIDMPVYRMDNLRTGVAQAAYVRDHGLRAMYFSAGEEDPEAQRQQHDILVHFAKDPANNIYDRLSQKRELDQPLLATPSGVIVNGNRRLASMRELLAEDPAQNGNFSHVDIAILPAATESDLTALEIQLQVAKDYKQPYGWVETAVGLRKCIDELHWDYAVLVAQWDMPEAELRALRSRLDLAEEYLETIGKPLHYELVEGDRQVFQTLQTKQAARQNAQVDVARIRAEKLLTFAVIAHKDADGFEGATHDFAKEMDELLPIVLDSPVVQEALAAQELPAPTNDDDDDPLDDLPDATEAVTPAVLAVLADQDLGEALALAAKEARDIRLAKIKDKKRGNALAETAKKINSGAASLGLTNSTPSGMEIAVAQLVAALPHVANTLEGILAEVPEIAEKVDLSSLVTVAKRLAALAPKED
jgi:hypothetical protein